jgi:hypothetical protein
LWIDNLDDAQEVLLATRSSIGRPIPTTPSAPAPASVLVLQEFKEWFDNERFQRVWHQYGIDKYVMWNEGIDATDFGGDTMHMGRLQDTSGSRFTQPPLIRSQEVYNMKRAKHIFETYMLLRHDRDLSVCDYFGWHILRRHRCLV